MKKDMTLRVGDTFTHPHRGTFTVVERPEEGFETVMEGALFIHFHDRDVVESRDPVYFIGELFGDSASRLTLETGE